MTEEQIALARRAVECRGWRWMPGMLTINGGRVFAVDEDGSCRLDFGAEEVPFWCTPQTMANLLPDLTDPATLGCLLALVREVWGDHATSFANGYEEPQDAWVVHNGQFSSDDYGHEIAKGSTEVEALVAALETAQ